MNIIAIIGHGLTPKGKGWGRKIDYETDLVVRMWNYHWQDPVDYGTKYDYGFYEVSSAEMARFWKHNIRFPAVAWLAFDLHPCLDKMPNGKTIQINPEKWVIEAIRMGGIGERNKRLKLTRGVRAAAWAIEQRPKRLVLVGFDNVYAGTGLTIEQGYPAEYVACKAGFPFRDYKGGSTKYSSHDYAIEGPFLSKLASRFGVEIVHAQDIW